MPASSSGTGGEAGIAAEYTGSGGGGTEAVVEAIGRPAGTLNLRGCEDELDVRVDVAVRQRRLRRGDSRSFRLHEAPVRRGTCPAGTTTVKPPVAVVSVVRRSPVVDVHDCDGPPRRSSSTPHRTRAPSPASRPLLADGPRPVSATGVSPAARRAQEQRKRERCHHRDGPSAAVAITRVWQLATRTASHARPLCNSRATSGRSSTEDVEICSGWLRHRTRQAREKIRIARSLRESAARASGA